MFIVSVCHLPKQPGHVINNDMLLKRKRYVQAARSIMENNTAKCKETSKMAYEVKRDCYKKAYASDPEKFKEASKKAYGK